MAGKLLSGLKKGFGGEEEKKIVTPAATGAVEFPRENEKVSPGHYAVRVTGFPGDQVQISINKGDWQDCRFAAGHFWFDWFPVKPGKYNLQARLKKGGKGKPVSGDPRNCQVVG